MAAKLFPNIDPRFSTALVKVALRALKLDSEHPYGSVENANATAQLLNFNGEHDETLLAAELYTIMQKIENVWPDTLDHQLLMEIIFTNDPTYQYDGLNKQLIGAEGKTVKQIANDVFGNSELGVTAVALAFEEVGFDHGYPYGSIRNVQATIAKRLLSNGGNSTAQLEPKDLIIAFNEFDSNYVGKPEHSPSRAASDLFLRINYPYYTNLVEADRYYREHLEFTEWVESLNMSAYIDKKGHPILQSRTEFAIKILTELNVNPNLVGITGRTKTLLEKIAHSILEVAAPYAALSHDLYSDHVINLGPETPLYKWFLEYPYTDTLVREVSSYNEGNLSAKIQSSGNINLNDRWSKAYDNSAKIYTEFMVRTLRLKILEENGPAYVSAFDEPQYMYDHIEETELVDANQSQNGASYYETHIIPTRYIGFRGNNIIGPFKIDRRNNEILLWDNSMRGLLPGFRNSGFSSTYRLGIAGAISPKDYYYKDINKSIMRLKDGYLDATTNQKVTGVVLSFVPLHDAIKDAIDGNWGGFAINLGFDAVTLVPGFGPMAKGSKIAATSVRVASKQALRGSYKSGFSALSFGGKALFKGTAKTMKVIAIDALNLDVLQGGITSGAKYTAKFYKKGRAALKRNSASITPSDFSNKSSKFDIIKTPNREICLPKARRKRSPGADCAFPVGSKYIVEGDNLVFGIRGTQGWTEARLKQTHFKLIKDGYVFVGFHGTSIKGAENMMRSGIKSQSTRLATDPWDGFYVAQDPAVAFGYALDQKTGKNGVMMRIYLPQEEVNNMFATTMRLDLNDASDRAGQLLDYKLPLQRNALTGPEDAEGSLETIIGWPMAEKAVAVPSLIKTDQKFPGRDMTDTDYKQIERNISEVPEYRHLDVSENTLQKRLPHFPSTAGGYTTARLENGEIVTLREETYEGLYTQIHPISHEPVPGKPVVVKYESDLGPSFKEETSVTCLHKPKARSKRSITSCLPVVSWITTRREIKTDLIDKIGDIYEEYHGGFRNLTNHEIDNLKEALSELTSSLGKSRNADSQKVRRVLTEAPGLNRSLPNVEIVEYPEIMIHGGEKVSSFPNLASYLDYVNSKKLSSLDCQRIVSDLRKWSESLLESQGHKFDSEFQKGIVDRFSEIDRLEMQGFSVDQIEATRSQLFDLKLPRKIDDSIEISRQVEAEHMRYMSQFTSDEQVLLKKAIEDYTVDSSRINAYARGQENALGSVKYNIDKMDRIFEFFRSKGFLDKERTVYRFAKYKSGSKQDSPFGNAIKQGDIVSDKAFVSTSGDKYFLFNNGSLGLRKPDDVIVRFVIEGPGGANISGSSIYNNAKASLNYEQLVSKANNAPTPDEKKLYLELADENRLGQAEILFPRNTQFLVREVEVQNSGKDVYVSLQVISDDSISKVKDMYTGEFITLDRSRL